MSDSQVIAQLLPFVIFNILLAIPCHFLLKKKGYSGPIIFLCYIPIVGCFFFPIAIGMPDLIAREMIKQLAEKKETKKCPFCAEDIQKEAVFCKHCKRNLEP